MTYGTSYRSGTVTLTNGSPTVTGALVSWLDNVKEGDLFIDLATWNLGEVLSVDSASSITLKDNWSTTGGSGRAYAILRFSRLWFSGGDLALALALYNSNRPTFIPTTGKPSDSVGANGNIAVDGAAGRYYIKTGGAWDNGTSMIGPTMPGSTTVGNVPTWANTGGTQLAAGFPVTTFAKTFLDDTSAAAVQATLGLREVLTSNRTYYVRTDGNNANTGLANNAGGAVSTINQALLLVSRLDLNSFSVTIQLGTGVGGDVSCIYRWVGTGAVSLVGDVVTPANNVVTFMGITNRSSLRISGLRFASPAWIGLDIAGGSECEIVGNCEFGVCGAQHIRVNDRSKLLISSPYSIVGGATGHYLLAANSTIEKTAGAAYVITVTGTPAISTFAEATMGSILNLWATSFSGSATGKRYSATGGGIIVTSGGGANYFPGNSAGTADETWQYS